MVARGVGGRELGERGEGIKNERLAVAQQSRGCKVQYRECSQ